MSTSSCVAGSRPDIVDAELLAEALERAAPNRRSHWSVEGQTVARHTVPAFTLGLFLNHDNSERVNKGGKRMIRLIAVAAFALAVATSAEAMTPAPIHLSGGVITQVALGCGVGRTRVGGVCVARTTIRHARRAVRRCARWHGGVCARYY